MYDTSYNYPDSSFYGRQNTQDPNDPSRISQDRPGKGRGQEAECGPDEIPVPTQDGWDCKARNTTPGPVNTNCPEGQTFDNPTQKCLPMCPEGQARNGAGDCVDLGLGGGKPDDGGPGGGKSPITPAPASPKPYEWKDWVPPAKTPFELNLEEELSAFLKGAGTDVPFTPQVVQNMKTSAHRAATGTAIQDKNAIEADAIQRGVYRASHTGDRLDTARRAQESTYAQAARETDITAAIQNDMAIYRNKTAALDRAQAHVNAERDYLLSSQMADFERQKGMADVSIAYYNLEQQRWALQNQFSLSKYGIDMNKASADLQAQMALFNAMLQQAG